MSERDGGRESGQMKHTITYIELTLTHTLCVGVFCVLRGVADGPFLLESFLIFERALAASSKAVDTEDVNLRRISGSEKVCGSNFESSLVPKCVTRFQ